MREGPGSQARDRRAKKRLIELIDVARASLQSNWLPDVFAAVFDVVAFSGDGMPYEYVLRDDAAELGFFIQSHLAELRHSQDQQLGAVPVTFKRVVDAALSHYAAGAEKEAGRGLIFVLHAIDSVFWGLAPAAGGTDEWLYLAMYRAMLREGQALLRQVPGYLLPRVGRAVHPALTECDFFSNLCRVHAQDGCNVRYLLFDELNPLGHAWPATGSRSMRVGVVAVVQHHSELTWTPDPKRGVYTVSLSRKAQAAVIERTLNGLQWLSEQGAEIVLLPELVSSSALDRRIREWLQQRESRKPRLVITGTYVKPPSNKSRARRNRAHAIDCSGLQLWHQDKLHRYNFTTEHQRLGRCVLADVDLVEDIDVSSRSLFIADSPLGERIAIMICEDFSHVLPHKQLLVELGVNVILVPVMNPAREDPRADWIRRYALGFAREPGALSLVGNSGALLFPDGRPRLPSDYVCAIDSYKTKVYDSAQPYPKPDIDAVLLQVEL